MSSAPIGVAPGLVPPQASITPAMATAPVSAATLPAPTDLTSALAALSQALQGLQQVLAGMQAVQGGGAPAPTVDPAQQDPSQAPASSGCSCCASMQAQDGTDALQSPPPANTPSAPPPSAPVQAPKKDLGGGDVRQKIVQIANQEGDLGVTEDAGPDKDKAGRIREYRTAVTGEGENPDEAEAWCADFTSWVFKQAGAPLGNGGKGEDYVPFLKDWAKGNNRWKTADPKPGDAVIFNWDSSKAGTPSHVGVVVKVEGGKIFTVEGNASDKVARKSYDVNAGVIQGFVSPQ